jgi:VWFA-related protein
MLPRTAKTFLTLTTLVVLLAISPLAVLADNLVDVMVLDVQAEPLSDEIAYQVTAQVSVVDNAGNPIENLTGSDFSLKEDGISVDLTSADFVNDAPVNLVLVLDAGYSMDGEKLTAAKTAALEFVSSLGAADNIALISFDKSVNVLQNFTTDHEAINQAIGNITAASDQGRCLYDALYQAVQMTNILPAGKRAVAVLTDGADDLEGQPCSQHSVNDVISLASDRVNKIPVYTLGLGRLVDAEALQNISTSTRGRYQMASSPDQLGATFLRLTDQLKSSYVLRYKSVATQGTRWLTVEVAYMGEDDKDMSDFVLPSFPTRIAFLALTDGQNVSGRQVLTVAVSGSEQIGKITFEVNGEQIVELAAGLVDAEIDFSAYPAGPLSITAIAWSTDNVELARVTAQVVVLPPPTPEPTATLPLTPVDTPLPSILPTPIPAPGRIPLIWLAVGGAGLGVILLVFILVLFLVVRKNKQTKARAEAWDKAQRWNEPKAKAEPAITQEQWIPSSIALGLLLILQSSDPFMVGQRFEIVKGETTLGRGAANDIILAKDGSVSRRHALLTIQANRATLREATWKNEKGSSSTPASGTFVNNARIGPEPVLLKSGDVINLGRRVQIRYVALERDDSQSAPTVVVPTIKPQDEAKG